MRKYILTTLVLIGSVLVFTTLEAQVGIGTDSPSNTLHLKPADSNENPIRIEDLNQIMQGDSALLVVDPATGVIRFMHLDSIFQHMTIDVDIDSENELQDADEVPLNPDLDIDSDGIVESNVQAAIENWALPYQKGPLYP